MGILNAVKAAAKATSKKVKPKKKSPNATPAKRGETYKEKEKAVQTVKEGQSRATKYDNQYAQKNYDFYKGAKHTPADEVAAGKKRAVSEMRGNAKKNIDDPRGGLLPAEEKKAKEQARSVMKKKIAEKAAKIRKEAEKKKKTKK